jgi:hypothetical protein
MAPEATPLSTDPEDPNYDPYLLTPEMNMRAQTLFEREGRDPIWAPAIERRIAETLHRDFAVCLPNREPLVQECRSSTCLVTVEVPDGLSPIQKQLAFVMPQLARLGSSVEPNRIGNTITFAMTIARDRRDLDQFEAQMTAGRRRLIESIRNGQQPQKTEALAPQSSTATGASQKPADCDQTESRVLQALLPHGQRAGRVASFCQASSSSRPGSFTPAHPCRW